MTDIKILVVDDEVDTREFLVSSLESQGFEVKAIESGNEILGVLKSFAPSLVLLDYTLPGKSGVEIVSILRKHEVYHSLPIIMVTGLDKEEEKVAALELGADDYVVKPFSSKELAARIRAVLRRTPLEVNNETIEHGGIMVDLRSHKVMAGGTEIYLTLTEFRILSELLRQRGRVLTRDRLRETALGNLNVTDRTIDVHMASLRKKLAEFALAIETVRGVGYRYSGS